MIDLHSHILPAVDDGAPDIATALQMAKAYVDQGVFCVACTPHIMPAIYDNDAVGIRQAVANLQRRVLDAGLDLELRSGADNHMVPEFAAKLAGGFLLTLADSRYVLVEPPHHVAPGRIAEFFFGLQMAGYVPILTHPERLSWIEDRYGVMQHLASCGVWMQITSGALRGTFGRRPRYWAERMLCEGAVDIIASDAHNMSGRRPDLISGFRAAERLVGVEEARNLCIKRPQGIVANVPPDQLTTAARGDTNETWPERAGIVPSGPVGRPGGVLGRLRRLFVD